MTKAIREFKHELAAVMEREWERLTAKQRKGILGMYDQLAEKGELNDNIFIEQWKRERGG